MRHLLQQTKAVQIRHDHVADHNVWLQPRNLQKRGFAVHCRTNNGNISILTKRIG